MSTIDLTQRRVPPFGGLSARLFRIELRRLFRNRRTVIFTLILPAGLFLAFGSGGDWNDAMGRGNVAAYVMTSMALYGAALSAAAVGAMVGLERSLGWSRQLRSTPLNPVAYIAMKATIALVSGILALAVVNVVGAVQGRPDLSVGIWLGCALLTVLCTTVFAALGVFVGYLVPGENAMQILGPGLALCSFLGNVFIPMDEGTTIYRIAEWTPMFGVAEISRSPLTGDLSVAAVLNAVVWLGIFVAGAAWRMAKDTARV